MYIYVYFQVIQMQICFIQILGSCLVQFLKDNPDIKRFQQDNDPKHTSIKAKSFMEEKNINQWKTPPESPDLNPIEKVWAQLKEHLCHPVKPLTQKELVKGIETFGQPR